MSNIIEITDEAINVVRDEVENEEFDIENSRVGLYVMLSMSAVAGMWGCVCLVCGLGSCGSISTLGKGLLTAFTGM